ncbi:NERD domain-containing protein [Streptomyces sp. NPDC048590]|uniref:NERD domain-containing protein n=1 Tax=Streptomyces sp. NPDC048590 TaxID=3365574 RepID=UPI0037248D13
MQDLKVTSWQLFGHDRLYVNLPDGTAIGWADRGSGTITVLHPRYRDAVTDALARQVPDLPALVGEEVPARVPGPPPPPPVPRIPPMRGLRKRGAEPVLSPLPAQETAPGPEREPAPGPGTSSVPAPSQVPAPDAGPEPVRREAAPDGGSESVRREAAPGAGTETEHRPRRRPAVLPALTPADDLAARRPGAGLREQLGESGAGALVRTATAALRRHRDGDPRRGALAGERRVGSELRRLTRHGWRILHSVPLPDGTEIGHLLIGPGGVFAVTTDHRPGASVRVGDGILRTDDAEPVPYELGPRPEAGYARTVLETYCAFGVPVESVLVFTGVTGLEVAATPEGVRVYGERQVSALAPLTGVLTPTQVERVYDVARNAVAWLEG